MNKPRLFILILLSLMSLPTRAAQQAPLVDEKARQITIGGRIAKQNVYEQLKGAIEYLAVCPGGKEYEALLICPVDAAQLHGAMVRIGLRPGAPAYDKEGVWQPPRGDALRIEVEWDEAGKKRRIGVEELVLDSMAQGTMSPLRWVFVGSRQAQHPETGKPVLEAAITGNLISLHQLDPTVLVQSPASEASESGRYKADLKKLPKEGTPVSLILRAVAVQRLHVLITGGVQGVGFREFALRTAAGLGLRGWARNLPNGQVELVAEGEAEPLTLFRKAIEKGPRGASVQQVHDVTPPSTRPVGEFEIRPTPER